MALIDTLPLFRIKPVSIEPVQSKLAPKQKEITVEPVETKPEIGETTAAYNITLPDIYKEYEPLAEALNTSEIKSSDAKAAVIAQMGLERGWKAPSDHNYGNITAGGAWSGKVSVRGDKDAKGNPITQKFRVYNSPKEFVSDYLSVLKTTYPAAYTELTSDRFDIDKFSDALTSGKLKYAEDPEYKQKVNSVYLSVLQNINKNNNNK